MNSPEQPRRLYPDPPPHLTSLSIRRGLAFVGPGMIIASVTIGSGELVWASRSGAIFGCQLLWCFLFAGLFKAIQVYTAARQMTLTGEHPLVSWKQLPGPSMWFPLLIALPTLAVMPIAFSAISEILGGYLRELTGVSGGSQALGTWQGVEFWNNFWASAVLSTCLVLALGSSLKTLEHVSALVLGLIVLCVLVSVVVCQPNLVEIGAGLILPRCLANASGYCFPVFHSRLWYGNSRKSQHQNWRVGLVWDFPGKTHLRNSKLGRR